MTDVEVGLVLASGQGVFILDEEELDYDTTPSYSELGGVIDFSLRPQAEKSMLASPLTSFPEQTYTTATYGFRGSGVGHGTYNLIITVARTGDRDQLTVSATKTPGVDTGAYVEIRMFTSTGETSTVLSGALNPGSSGPLFYTFYPGLTADIMDPGSTFDRLELWDRGNVFFDPPESPIYIADLSIPEEPFRDQVVIYGGPVA